MLKEREATRFLLDFMDRFDCGNEWTMCVLRRTCSATMSTISTRPLLWNHRERVSAILLSLYMFGESTFLLGVEDLQLAESAS